MQVRIPQLVRGDLGDAIATWNCKLNRRLQGSRAQLLRADDNTLNDRASIRDFPGDEVVRLALFEA